MATYYWYGGSGNWSDYTNHWSTNSGNSPSAPAPNAPTSADNVIFDANSGTGTVTINTSGACLDFNAANTSLLTVAGNSNIEVYGSLTLKSGMTWSAGGYWTFKSTTTTNTITTNGVTISGGSFRFQGAGGKWTLGSAFTINGTLDVLEGTFDVGTYNLTAYTLSSSGTATRAINLNATTVHLQHSAAIQFSGTGMTFDCGTATINIDGGSGSFTGNGYTFYNVNIYSLNAFSDWDITGANTFNNLSFYSNNKLTNFRLGANQTISGTLTITGTETSRTSFCSNVGGTQRTLTAAAVSLSYVDFQDIVGAGAATWSGTSLGDCLNNSNITLASPTTQHFTNVNGGGFNTAANWTSRIPLPQDTCVIDCAFGTSKTVTLDISRVGEIDFSGATWTTGLTFACSISARLLGNITFKSGMTVNHTATWYFWGRSVTLTTNGVTLTANPNFDIYTAGSSLIFGDNVTVSGTAYFRVNNNCTLNTNGKNLSVSGVNGFSGSTLTFGASIITLYGTGSVFAVNSDTTLNAGTSKVIVSNTTATAKTLSLNTGKNLYDLEITGDNVTLYINGRTLHELKLNNPGLTNGTLLGNNTTAVNLTSFVATGTAGNLIKFTTSKISITSGVVVCDYVSFLNCVALGGAEFYAGPTTRSTNSGGNTGWKFADFLTKTGAAKARVKVNVNKTGSVKARIKSTGIVKTASTKARIKVLAGGVAPYILGTPTTGGSTISHAVVAGTNVLVVTCGRHQGTITGVTFDGDALTRADWGDTQYHETGQVWYLPNPTVKTANVVIATDGGSGTLGTCINLGGVGNTTPENHQNNDGDSNYATLNYQTLQANAIVIECEYSEAVPSTVDNATIISTQQAGNAYENLQSTYVYRASASTQQIGHDLSYGSRWASAGASWVGVQANTKTASAKAAVVVGIQDAVLYSPADESARSSPVYLEWTIPSNSLATNQYFILQLDKTSNAFGDLEVNKNSLVDSGFEYWDGAQWVAATSTGVPNAYAGNQARYLINVTVGHKYWRVLAFTT